MTETPEMQAAREIRLAIYGQATDTEIVALIREKATGPLREEITLEKQHQNEGYKVPALEQEIAGLRAENKTLRALLNEAYELLKIQDELEREASFLRVIKWLARATEVQNGQKCQKCSRPKAEHSREALTEPNPHNWKWLENACPVGDGPFHPGQVFE